MSMKPPAHICGQMKNTSPIEVRQERLAWVHAANEAGIRQVEIARMLGVTDALVRKLLTQSPPTSAEPEAGAAMTYIRTIGPFSHREAPVSLVRAPWDAPTATPDARPETAPPRDIRGRRNGVTPEGFIAILRAECLKARAEA